MEASSNMVIVDMKLLSGFQVEPSSLDEVRHFKPASMRVSPQIFTEYFSLC